MSTEFFYTMEMIEKKARTIKFLEGSHPELFSKYNGESKMLLFGLDTIEKKMTEDLKKKAKAKDVALVKKIKK